MEIVIETPKWSFVKYRFVDGMFVKSLRSPFPTIFNYGFIVGSVGGDGAPKDVIVLGEKMKQGDRTNSSIAGYVKFLDMDKQDDKAISKPSGKLTFYDRLKINIFFSFYSIFKRFYYRIKGIKPNTCRYNGIILNNMQ